MKEFCNFTTASNIEKEIDTIQEEFMYKIQNVKKKIKKTKADQNQMQKLKLKLKQMKEFLLKSKKGEKKIEDNQRHKKANLEQNFVKKNNILGEFNITQQDISSINCKNLSQVLTDQLYHINNIDEFIQIIKEQCQHDNNLKVIIELQNILKYKLKQIKNQNDKDFLRIQQLIYCIQQLYVKIQNLKCSKNQSISIEQRNQMTLQELEQEFLDAYTQKKSDKEYFRKFLRKKIYNNNQYTLLEQYLLSTQNDENSIIKMDDKLLKFCQEIMKNYYSVSDFFEYCIIGNIQAIYCIVTDNGTEILEKPNEEDMYKRTGLLFACWEGRYDIVRIMREQFKINLEQKNSHGWTALIVSSILNKKDIVEYLLEHNVDLENSDQDNCTALLYACNQGHKEIVEILLNHNANVNHVAKNSWNSLLYACRHNENKDIVEMLLNYDVNIDYQNNEGLTGLLMTCFHNPNKEIIETLLKHNANTEIQIERGFTALLVACRYIKDKNIIELLLKYKANMNHQNDLGFTPFMLACYSNSLDVVITLLNQNYTNVDHRNVINLSAYDFLTEQNKRKLRDYIETHNLQVRKPEIQQNKQFIQHLTFHVILIFLYQLLKKGETLYYKQISKQIKQIYFIIFFQEFKILYIILIIFQQMLYTTCIQIDIKPLHQQCNIKQQTIFWFYQTLNIPIYIK